MTAKVLIRVWKCSAHNLDALTIEHLDGTNGTRMLGARCCLGMRAQVEAQFGPLGIGQMQALIDGLDDIVADMKDEEVRAGVRQRDPDDVPIPPAEEDRQTMMRTEPGWLIERSRKP